MSSSFFKDTRRLIRDTVHKYNVSTRALRISPKRLHRVIYSMSEFLNVMIFCRTTRKKYYTINRKNNLFVEYFKVLHDIYVYGIDANEFYIFGFSGLSSYEKSEYFGSLMHIRVDRHLNKPDFEYITKDKWETYQRLNPYFHRQVKLIKSHDDICNFVDNESWGGGLVLKPRQGQEGIGVEVIFPKIKDELQVKLEDKLIHGQFIIEEKIVQHPKISAIYSGSVNTIRVITIKSDRVRVVRAAMRFGNGKSVDNVSGGGIAAPVDIKTGLIYDGAVSKGTSNRHYLHPISGKAIKGFTIPFWDKVLELVCEAAESISEQRSIGWDIAVTSDGPVIVEVNSGWGRVLAQAPHQQGIMPLIASEVDDEVLNPIHRKMKKIWKQQ